MAYETTHPMNSARSKNVRKMNEAARRVKLDDRLNSTERTYAGSGKWRTRAAATVTGHLEVVTGLDSVDSVQLTLKGSLASGFLTPALVSWSASGTAGSIWVHVYKHTSTSDPTLLDATVACTVEWEAVGTIADAD